MSRRRRFGATWWGRAWITALEGRARLDPNRLPRGRTYARHNRVDRVAIEPGRITALVSGRRARPYRVEVRVRQLTAEEWDGVIEVIASRAGHAAALLDGELVPAVDDDARDIGVELLPDVGELQPRCSCPDWADPCKHAAAVCYLVADELDDDPFLLLELRGRTREQVLASLRATRASGAAVGGDPDGDRRRATPETVEARDGFAAWSERSSGTGASGQGPGEPHPSSGRGADPAALPALAEPVTAAVAPAPWPVPPPPSSGLDGDGLRLLALDAASRARAMLVDNTPSMLGLGSQHDLARRAAAVLGTDAFDELSGRSGIKPRQLARLAIAWREGGADAVDVSTASPWRPSPEPLIAARAAVTEAGIDPRSVTVTANRVTIGGTLQLRYGHDGRWYRFHKSSGAWELAAPPADDPADLL
jgi:uncharacterized Zn finger protein